MILLSRETLTVIITVILVLSFIAFAVTVTVRMLKARKKGINQEFSRDVPGIILSTQSTWHKAYVWWVIVQYGLELLGALFSLGSVNFAATNLLGKDEAFGLILLAFSLLSALCGTVIALMQPKTNVRRYFDCAFGMELAISRYENYLITKEDLFVRYEHYLSLAGE